MYVCMYVCMYVFIYVFMYVCMYVYMYICIYVCMYVCMYLYMYLCMYVCMHACMHVPCHISILAHPDRLIFYHTLIALSSPPPLLPTWSRGAEKMALQKVVGWLARELVVSNASLCPSPYLPAGYATLRKSLLSVWCSGIER